MKKVLVLATSFLDELATHPPQQGRAKKMLDELAENSQGEIEIVYRCERSPKEPLRASEFKDVAAVIADLETYDRELLSQIGLKGGGSLGLIARYGIGYNSVDIRAAADYGVIVTNCPGCNSVPTAEWAHSTILDVAGRRILHYMTASAGKPKEGPPRLDVSGKVLGIVGTGNIGRAVLGLMRGYGMKAFAYDTFPDEKWAKKEGVEYVDLDELCRTADFITLHAAANRTIITSEKIAMMKPTAVLVNCAREILVDQRAAYDAVKEGKLWGYGVDESWTDSDLPLAGLNIIASPHVGSDTDTGKVGMQIISTRAVIDFMQGTTPKHIIKPG